MSYVCRVHYEKQKHRFFLISLSQICALTISISRLIPKSHLWIFVYSWVLLLNIHHWLHWIWREVSQRCVRKLCELLLFSKYWNYKVCLPLFILSTVWPLTHLRWSDSGFIPFLALISSWMKYKNSVVVRKTWQISLLMGVCITSGEYRIKCLVVRVHPP